MYFPAGEFPFKPRAVSITPGRKFEDNYILKEEIGKLVFSAVHYLHCKLLLMLITVGIDVQKL